MPDDQGRSSEPELTTYAGNPGEWTEDRPATPSEALLLAARCASAAGDITVPHAVQIARAAQSQAWAAIAAATPIEAAVAWRQSSGAAVCEHHRTVLRSGDHWVHVDTLTRCDALAEPL